jgi:hypothetical protein
LKMLVEPGFPPSGDTLRAMVASINKLTSFGARGISSVRYGTRLGDLKNKQSTHTRGMSSVRYGIRLGDLKNKQSTHTLELSLQSPLVINIDGEIASAPYLF